MFLYFLKRGRKTESYSMQRATALTELGLGLNRVISSSENTAFLPLYSKS